MKKSLQVQSKRMLYDFAKKEKKLNDVIGGVGVFS
jgi:hypothetical protein